MSLSTAPTDAAIDRCARIVAGGGVTVVGASAPCLEELGAAFWPAGVTLVIPARPEVDDHTTDAHRTMAVRVPGG